MQPAAQSIISIEIHPGAAMTEILDYVRLEAFLLALDSKEMDCRGRITTMRHMMDRACDSRTITLAQWRSLLERVSLVQARCVDVQPDAWGRPPLLPRSSDQP